MRFRLAVPLLLACSMPAVNAFASESRIHKVWYPSPLRSLSPDQLATSFLKSKASELDFDISTLRLIKSQESLLANHLVYQQFVGDLPIADATISVSILKAQQTVYQFYNSLAARPSPVMVKQTISLDQAYDAAWAYVGVQDELFQAPEAELRYTQTDHGLVLVYSVDLSPKAPYGAWRVDVDASSGQILSVKDLRVNEKSIPIPQSFGSPVKTIARVPAFEKWQKKFKADEVVGERKNGNAAVFDPDPKTEMNNDTITDKSPASAFESAYVQRVLPDLSLTDGIYKLSGPWVKIIDFDPPTAAPTTTKDGKWAFLRGQGGFTDSMTYFHVDQSQRYIQSLGFKDDTGIQFKSIEVDADGANGDDNSYFMPSTNRLAFGHGCVDDNEDSDVILHEYGHAIHYSINSSWSGGDSGAMGEGFGDYWAASYSYSTPKGRTFQVDRVYNWDAGNCWAGRGMDATSSMYNHSTSYSAHSSISGGRQSDELWSTPLFQAHKALIALDVPREEIDTIILEAQFGLGSMLKMRDMAQSIVDTARRLYPDGPHAEEFRKKFVAQGILLEPKTELVASLGAVEDDDGVVDPGESPIFPLKIANSGDKLATGTTAVITTDDEFISALTDEFSLGDIAAGKSVSVKLGFTVAENVPCGHIVTLNVTVKTADGKSWATPVKVLVGKAIEASVASSANLPIPDKDTLGISSKLDLESTAEVSPTFSVDLNVKHPYVGDLKITLVSPQGTEVVLHDRSGGSQDNLIGTYPTTLKPKDGFTKLEGEKLDGAWTLKVADAASGDTGSLVSWGIKDVSGYECR